MHEQRALRSLLRESLDLAALKAQPPASAPLVQKLGLYEKFTAIVGRFDTPVEYGVVEYEFAYAHPDDYRTLCGRFGHRAIEQGREYTASAYLGRMLGNLWRHGKVRYPPTKGTGRWAYDTDISG